MPALSRPPRLSTKLLEWIALWDGEYGAAGDLEELYHLRCRERGVRRARWSYRLQVAAALPGFLKNLVYWSRQMLKNYFLVAWRNIRRHKGYAFINISGLAVGLACALFIWLWVQDELSYDRFHAKAPALFRVEQDQPTAQGAFHVNLTAFPLGPSLPAEIPEIRRATRYANVETLLVRSGDKVFFESSVLAVDPEFLEMFDFPLIRGDRGTVLNNPHSVVLSEDTAEKYFGTADPLGKTLLVNNSIPLAVAGIIKNAPPNSTLTQDFLVRLEFMTSLGWNINAWGSNEIITWLELHDPAASPAVGDKITKLMTERFIAAFRDNPQAQAQARNRPRPRYTLRPLTDIRLKAVFGFGQARGTLQNVKTFSVIALLVLLIACINFMNLATARAANRAREVGLRKVVGAVRGNIVSQFYGESGLTTLLSLLIALTLVAVLRPAFNSLAGKEIPLAALFSLPFLGGLAALAAAAAFGAGSYPSLLLSSLRPVNIFRGRAVAGARSASFRKLLVIVQFGLSVMLLIGTGVVYRQIGFMQRKALGFDKDHLIYLPLRGETSASYPRFKEELLRDPRVLGVSGTDQQPTRISANSGGATWEGKDPGLRVLLGETSVDFDYPETMKIEMAAGRPFSRDFAADKGGAFLVNEETVKLMGLEPRDAVGKPFAFAGIKGTIIGVMKNYHYKPVQNAIEPMAVMVAPEAVRFAVVRLGGGDLPLALKQVESVWAKVFSAYPFEARFFDQDLERSMQAFGRMGGILRWFTGMAVFIACLGLFGLASFLAEQRRKEIGVRKVLGASARGVVILMSRDFAKWVLLANLVAWPAAYLVMRSWLQKFPYRTAIPPGLFVLAGAGALVIALLTVSGQAWRAARTNPAEALKYE